jgi:hypothetical protein
VIAAGALVAAWRGRPAVRRALAPVRFPATVALVATVVHAALAAIDGSLRYENYLIVLGVWALLRLVRAAGPLVPGRLGDLLPALALLALLPFAHLQLRAAASIPRDADVMAAQRYAAARFLEESYDRESIAVSELGYAGLYHDGPLTDVYGLGDHEVARAWIDDRLSPAYWAELTEARDFRVVVAYDFSLAGTEPPGWVPVATWETPSAYYEDLVFWAADASEILPLREAIEAYELRLPAGTTVRYNDLAPLLAP